MRTDNIHRVLDKADEIDIREGLAAYGRYRETMLRFAKHYGCKLESVVAAFVAMSPNNDYKGNLKSLATLLHGIKEGWDLEEITVTTYKACRDRAYSFARCDKDFLEVTRGPKTRSFYQNIIDPSNSSPVTIDGHMLSIWHGRYMTMKEAVRSRYRYEDVAQGVREVAFMRGFVPCQVQAICWFTWKRIHKAVYDPQLNLFASGDQWGTEVSPVHIKPFTRKVAA